MLPCQQILFATEHIQHNYSPSLFFPPGATAGSIVNIAVRQNHVAEEKEEREFGGLQQRRSVSLFPLKDFPAAQCDAETLKWRAISPVTSKPRSVDIFRNSQRPAAIPSPMKNVSTILYQRALQVNSTYPSSSQDGSQLDILRNGTSMFFTAFAYDYKWVGCFFVLLFHCSLSSFVSRLKSDVSLIWISFDASSAGPTSMFSHCASCYLLLLFLFISLLSLLSYEGGVRVGEK